MKNYKYVVLSGGVGGARFLEGLVQIVPPEKIFVIGNTGDDREFYGLYVSPDIDIVIYTLAGIVNQTQGWGLQDETYAAMNQLTKLGNENWFMLGDKDLATHVHRTNLLRQGKTASQITQELCDRFGVPVKLVPMSDDLIQTFIKTPGGRIHFEEYLVKNRAEDTILDIIYRGAEQAKPAPGIIDAIMHAESIIIAPSNPLVSIGSILSVPGIREALKKTKAPISAISPIIGGAPVKGPADTMMQSVGIEVSPIGIAKQYLDFLDVMVIDTKDEEYTNQLEKLGLQVITTDTIMRNAQAKKALAQATFDALKTLAT